MFGQKSPQKCRNEDKKPTAKEQRCDEMVFQLPKGNNSSNNSSQKEEEEEEEEDGKR